MASICDVINLSSASVTFGAGVIASSGSSSLPAGQAAALRGINYSGGNVVFAMVAGNDSGGAGATPPALPGQVTGLSAGSPTASSIVLTWSAPSLRRCGQQLYRPISRQRRIRMDHIRLGSFNHERDGHRARGRNSV